MQNKIVCELCGKNIRINQIKRHLKHWHKGLDILSSKEKILEYIIKKFYFCENVDVLIEEYASGVSMNEISKKHNVSYHLLLELFEIKNIPVRGIKEANNQSCVKEKVKNYFVDKFGVDNPSKVEEIKNKKIKTHFENFLTANNFGIKSILDKAKKTLKERFQSAEFVELIREKYKNTLKERYGDNIKNVSQVSSVRRKISSTKKGNCSKLSREEKLQMTAAARKSTLNLSTSKIELMVQEALNLLGIGYEKNKQTYYYNCDIVIGKKIIIEVQGDLFHANPEIYKGTDIIPLVNKTSFEIWGKDKHKKDFLEKKGYKVIWIWESEIRKRSSKELVSLMSKYLIENTL